MNSFRVGQKVVCVDAAGSGRMLVNGRVYTVSCLGISPLGNPVINLEEAVSTSIEGSWYSSRFRPVVERGTETGMSILRELLNTQDKPLEVVA